MTQTMTSADHARAQQYAREVLFAIQLGTACGLSPENALRMGQHVLMAMPQR